MKLYKILQRDNIECYQDKVCKMSFLIRYKIGQNEVRKE